MTCIRYVGSARNHLRCECIIVLSSAGAHRATAEALSLPVRNGGRLVAAARE
jgi:hypothetical protein